MLNLLENGKSLRDVAAQFGCRKTQMSSIKSEKDSIMTEWQSGGRSDLNYVEKRKTTYEALNKGQIQESPFQWKIDSGKNCLYIFALDVNVVRLCEKRHGQQINTNYIQTI